jgi:NADPH:quinone reductase
MRALVCHHFGPLADLAIGELPEPKPGSGQVLIAVRAAGVNFPDALMVEGRYQEKPALPFAPGGEVSGIIKTVGTEVTQFKPGDEVVALTLTGAFAERVIADERTITLKPKGVAHVTAASFLLTYGTSFHALVDRAQIRSGESLLVLGAGGGVGLAAVELGAQLGARVIAAASSEEKLAATRERGAAHTINYASEDLRDRLKEIVGAAGVDVVFDPVGGVFAEPALRSTGWRGRYLVIGFAAGDIPRIPLNLVLLKGSAIIGVFWGAFTKREPEQNRANTERLMKWLREGRLRPLVSEVYPLERAAEALQALVERKAIGKLVVSDAH